MTKCDLSDGGERVLATVRNWNYYSHLSVYRFAAPFLIAARVLDAGCGTGYGSAYLSEHGAAHVLGLDVSASAIDYCREAYSAPGLAFETADLSYSIPVPDASVDAIFSSQAMEHMADIETFMAECRRVLRPRGLMVIAVPSITTPAQLLQNIWNQYHVTNLTPLGWFTKIRRSFKSVQAFRHWPKAPFAGWDAIRAGLALPADDTSIRETDFDYMPAQIRELTNEPDNLNTVLVARRPRRRPLPPAVGEFIPHGRGEGAMHAHVRHEETELLRWKLWQLESGLNSPPSA